MAEWMDGWVLMNYIDQWTDEWIDSQTDNLKDGLVNRQMDGTVGDLSSRMDG